MKAGTRSGLWASMCDAIDIIRPRLVVWENVRGALSAEAAAGDVESCEFCVGGDGEPPLRALGRVLGDLAELGYDAAWTGLRAADVGAPHGRWRVFVVAWPAGDADGSGPGALAGAGGAAPDRTEVWRRPEATDALRPELGRCSAPVTWGSPEWRDLTLLPTPTTSDTNGPGAHGEGGADLRTTVSLLPTPRATDGTKGGPNQRGSSGDLMLPSAVTLLPTPRASDGPDASSHGRTWSKTDRSMHTIVNLGELSVETWGDYAPAIARWETILGRTAPAPTEPTGRDGAHRLSPAFVEFMMGLPSGWVT